MRNPTFIHDKAMCESQSIGVGTRIWAFCHVMATAVVGEDCNLGEGVFIEGGVVIGNRCTIKNSVAIWDRVQIMDDVFIGPSAVFTNDLRPRAFVKLKREQLRPTVVEMGATLGANCTVVCGVKIGAFAMVGSGTVVNRDIPAHALVVGNPARQIGRVCFCGTKLDKADYCAACRCHLRDNSLEKVRR